jgi:hypothetical protein
MRENAPNTWKVLTIALVVLLLVSITVYIIVLYVLPAWGLAIDVPLLALIGRSAILGFLMLVITIALPILLFLVVAMLLGFGFGLGLSSTPVGRAIIRNSR